MLLFDPELLNLFRVSLLIFINVIYIFLTFLPPNKSNENLFWELNKNSVQRKLNMSGIIK